ncbi:MAG: hypothetical protein KBT10_01070 [Bacteroidales bacterium]|nr:hypothetical protein [Candidatus Sodaliphilus aphodohippi]
MSSQKNVLEVILNSSRSVFNIQSLRMMTECKNSQKLTQSLHYYVKEGKIRNPRRGIYTKVTYDEKEMACSLFRPAYISLEYVLQRSGIVFQYDDTVTCVSYLNRIVEIDDKSFMFRIIKPELWIGMEGIEQHDNIMIATAERAFLDMVYLSAGNCYFDNLHPLNKAKVKQLLPLYQSKVLTERVIELLNLK